MLGVEYFNNDIIRKYTTVFGTLFNDIYIHRFGADKKRLQVIPVPAMHAPSAKHVALDEKNPIDSKVQSQLPRIAYYLTGITPAKERFTNPLNKNVVVMNATTMKTQWAETPYNFDYEVVVYAKTADDAHQIIGQILPFFRPSFTPTVNVIPEMGLKFDTKVELNSVTPNDDFQGTPDEPRIVSWTLSFTMNAYFFGPISTQGVIKRAIVDMINVPGDGPIGGDDIEEFGRVERITVTPGLTTDGKPTTDPNETIPPSEIDADDPYAYITQIEVFDDGKKWDPVSGTDK